jgi:ParB family chromosome partitioning protein
MTQSKRGLGKGLAALIPTKQPSAAARPEGTERYLKIAEIKPNRFQPRRFIREENLKELCDSIKEKGVIEPVVVRRSQQGGYELIAGERRLRACQKLGLSTIPAMVRQATDQEALEIALIENIQREDLNPLEEARGYQRLAKEFSLSQEQLAQKVGKDRSTVANSLRLLSLPPEVQAMVEDAKLSAGHARAVLMADDRKRQVWLAGMMIKKGMTVRQAEELARGGQASGRGRSQAKTPKALDQHLANIQSEMQRALGTRVRIMPQGKNRGRVEIEYYSWDDLERVMQRMGIKF